MQADKDVAEFTTKWYGDVAEVVIHCKHPESKVMVLATTFVWSGCGIAPVGFGVQDHVHAAWAVAKHDKQFACVRHAHALHLYTITH